MHVPVWEIGSLVTGVEADIQGSGIKASANAAPTSPSANSRLLIGEVISAEAEDIFGVVRKCQQEQSRLDRGRRRRMDVRA